MLRDGTRLDIPAADLVRGDLVLLEAGDRISADLTLVVVDGLAVDESTLTGESVPVHPEPDATVFAGTFVAQGEGRAVVATTGSGTKLAGIAATTQQTHRHAGPLTVRLNQVIRVVGIVALTVGVVFFGIALLLGLGLTEDFLLAVGVTVALVPEGLLPTVTLSLARAARTMAGRNALVRRLEAVETLGSTTVICTDKTGTITGNQMSVVRVWTPAGTAAVHGTGYRPEGTADSTAGTGATVVELAGAAVRCATGRTVQHDGTWVPLGDPMEVAIHVLALRCGLDTGADEAARQELRRVGFAPARRRSLAVVGGPGPATVIVSGASDAVLPLCGGAGPADAEVERMAAGGLRVLAIASGPLPAEVDAGGHVEALETNLHLLGLVGLQDPPREGVAEAMRTCRGAHVRLTMITGDHPTTARAIAEQVGLALPGSPVLTAADLPVDEAELGAAVDVDGAVIARAAPEDKLRIARALRARGHVVAMTGDGVNDGPALREADIGVAMGRSGTDVAREAADLVLLDDDFATIVTAITYGRATFANIRRFLTYHLTDNVAELAPFALWGLSGGGIPLAIGVLGDPGARHRHRPAARARARRRAARPRRAEGTGADRPAARRAAPRPRVRRARPGAGRRAARGVRRGAHGRRLAVGRGRPGRADRGGVGHRVHGGGTGAAGQRLRLPQRAAPGRALVAVGQPAAARGRRLRAGAPGGVPHGPAGRGRAGADAAHPARLGPRPPGDPGAPARRRRLQGGRSALMSGGSLAVDVIKDRRRPSTPMSRRGRPTRIPEPPRRAME